MRLPTTPSQDDADTHSAAQGKPHLSCECDEEPAIGWECAHPSLQIAFWNPERSPQPPDCTD